MSHHATLCYFDSTARQIMFKYNIIIWLIFIQDNWVLKIWYHESFNLQHEKSRKFDCMKLKKLK